MWKVVIVEDEAFVRDSIKQMIPWEQLGFLLAGEAGNGEDGLALVEELRPDVVIADIMMPKMDGIMMLKSARENGSEARFIMLTCMNEFEYARLALEYGASSYILKLSMTIDSLKESLAKVVKELTARGALSARLELERYEALYGKLWRTYKSADMEAVSADDGGAVRAEQGFPFVSLICVFHGDADLPKEALIRAGIAGLTDERAVVHSFSADGQTTFFCWSREAGIVLAPDHQAFASVACIYCPDLPTERLAHGWLNVLLKLDDFWYGNEPLRLRNAGSVPTVPRFPPRETVKRKYWGDWLSCFEHIRLSDCLKLLAGNWADMAHRRVPMLLVKEQAEQLLRLMEQYSRVPPQAYERVASAILHEQLRERMVRIISESVEESVRERSAFTDHAEINKVIGYVHSHYHENITLRSMASFVSMDESYFSNLFKKKTGASLIHYVQKIRIDRAKELLAEDKTVSQAAEMVGFVNGSYFIKIFKRFAQMSPAEFKRKSGG